MEQLKKEALQAAVDHVRANVEAKLRDVPCPDHPTAGQVTVDMSDFSGGQVSVTPCCEKVADQVQALVAEIERSDDS
jgi:hypothetical protein